MALSSMTGFARSHGTSGAYSWSWEIKSVNAKGLDFRLRLPPGWDAVEVAARKYAGAALVRGTVYATLAVERRGVAPIVKVNEPVLSAVLDTISGLRGRVDAAAPRLDGILALKGVIEISESEEGEDERRVAEAAVATGFERTMAQLIAMRQSEGDVLGRILAERLDRIAELTLRADRAPGRKPEAVRARLAAQIASLLENGSRFDADRLHQEALMLAARADIREELDRLAAHAEQVRKLLAEGAAVGRRLDFLAQELGRESNTLTAKANDVELTNIGIELKSVVEQFREQVQNIE